MGVGAVKHFSGMRWTLVERIVWAWIFTLPVTGLIGYLFERIGTTDGFHDLLGVLFILAVVAAGFGFTVFTRRGACDLAGLGALGQLDLSRARVTDEGLKHLASLRGLESLNLTATQVTDAGLKELAPLTRLQVLRLESTRVTDAGLKELPPSSSCRSYGSRTPG